MYPFEVLCRQCVVFPLFGTQLDGEPHIFDFSSANPKNRSLHTTDFEQFQRAVFDEMETNGRTWGIGRYLEERSTVLRDYPLMIAEGRTIHAGLDIIVPEGFRLHAPLAGTVFRTGKEEEVGSYGGYVVLEHGEGSGKFYALYGHLRSDHLVREGESIAAGHVIGSTGAYADSGGWFTHTHLQIITQDAYAQGRMFQGYVTADDLTGIEALFPSPYPMFRY